MRAVHGSTDNLTPAFRSGAPATSREAAYSMVGPAKKQRADVLAFLIERGEAGATDAEIEAALGMRHQSASPRRGELVASGLVVDSGKRRPTPSGRRAVVWVPATGATLAGGVA
jgi:hypothetical protein